MGDQAPFKRHQRVIAAEDLPGVPAGTPGRVIFTTGLEWLRYRVVFDNGVELGSLDARYLTRPPKDGGRAA